MLSWLRLRGSCRDRSRRSGHRYGASTAVAAGQQSRLPAAVVGQCGQPARNAGERTGHSAGRDHHAARRTSRGRHAGCPGLHARCGVRIVCRGLGRPAPPSPHHDDGRHRPVRGAGDRSGCLPARRPGHRAAVRRRVLRRRAERVLRHRFPGLPAGAGAPRRSGPGQQPPADQRAGRRGPRPGAGRMADRTGRRAAGRRRRRRQLCGLGILLGRIGHRGPARPHQADGKAGIHTQIRDGVRQVAASRALRAIAIAPRSSTCSAG